MEFLSLPLAKVLAGGFILLMGFVLLLNVFSLPANWLLLGLAALWKFLHPAAAMGWGFWAFMVGLALAGEALELGVQVMNARRHGSSSSGTFAGMLGAIAGAILLTPLFFGLGALIGALLGAFAGCLIMELLKGRPAGEAVNAALGAMLGRFLGTVCKCAAGGAMLAVTAGRIWPSAPPPPPVETLLTCLRGLC